MPQDGLPRGEGADEVVRKRGSATDTRHVPSSAGSPRRQHRRKRADTAARGPGREGSRARAETYAARTGSCAGDVHLGLRREPRPSLDVGDDSDDLRGTAPRTRRRGAAAGSRREGYLAPNARNQRTRCRPSSEGVKSRRRIPSTRKYAASPRCSSPSIRLPVAARAPRSGTRSSILRRTTGAEAMRPRSRRPPAPPSDRRGSSRR
jgi:hypothetical protein